MTQKGSAQEKERSRERGAGRGRGRSQRAGPRLVLKLPGVVSETFFTVEIDRQGPGKMFRRALPQNIALGRMSEMCNLLGGIAAGVASAFGGMRTICL